MTWERGVSIAAALAMAIVRLAGSGLAVSSE
jgi:hypothetical protein